jgi:holo-[acyl-carrier protein] synthase
MILGVGIDLVEIEKVKKIYNEKLVNRILSEKEKVIFNSITNEKRRLEYLAGRFSAKEAIFKAFKNSEEKNHNFNQISILNNIDGSPYVEFIKHDEIDYHISITHTDNYASSIVILYKR